MEEGGGGPALHRAARGACARAPSSWVLGRHLGVVCPHEWTGLSTVSAPGSHVPVGGVGLV
eukprot:361382-Chlamydomonas_euryale.AAC.9